MMDWVSTLLGWLRRDAGKARREDLPQDVDPENFVSRPTFLAAAGGHTGARHMLVSAATPTLRARAERTLRAVGRGEPGLQSDTLQHLLVLILTNTGDVLGKYDPALATQRRYFCWWANLRTIDYMRDGINSKAHESPKGENADARQFHAGYPISDPSAGATTRTEDQDFMEKFHAAFHARATAKQVELFQRVYENQEPPERIAGEQGIAVNSVHQQMRRLRQLIFEIRDELLTPRGG